MTIKEALLAINTYPVQDNTVEFICVDRGLVSSETYTKEIGESEAYQLARADIYLWLSTSPSITEQEVGINNAIAIKENMFSMAMSIYDTYGDTKYAAESYGFIGEDWNG